MKYNVIYGNTLGELIYQVDQMILKGWKPLGGVSVRDLNLQGYVQAMVFKDA